MLVNIIRKVESVNPKMQQKTKEHQKREIARTVFHVGHAGHLPIRNITIKYQSIPKSCFNHSNNKDTEGQEQKLLKRKKIKKYQ